MKGSQQFYAQFTIHINNKDCNYLYFMKTISQRKVTVTMPTYTYQVKSTLHRTVVSYVVKQKLLFKP